MKRTIDMMIRHHREKNVSRHKRDSSLSSISGDWASITEEQSTGEQSASDQSRRMSIVAEMAILASSSPEIKALSLRRGSSMLPSPSSSVASSTVANLSATSFAEEYKCQEDMDSETTKSVLGEQLAALAFENLRIEPPPCPRREEVSDIAKIINVDNNKENSLHQDTRCRVPPGTESSTIGPAQRSRRTSAGSATRVSHRDSFGSCGTRLSHRDSFGSCGSTRPPKHPAPSNASTPKSPQHRRPSMHRRVSFDSLPSPSEIGGSIPALLYSSASDRSIFSTPSPPPSSDRPSPHCKSSSSERSNPRAHHRKSASMLGVPRSLKFNSMDRQVKLGKDASLSKMYNS
ncbi:expressed unknown protein [Seminavis robusta]|uniref:Uncharacterized protein n=1 Tax=Seminavis robusta TaxID=568900 RepID=A0A9N8HFM0_9STRA|nr:expressed unknown protein [Seminavis robusta]|eukprot:Sro530_g161210.1 n/a (346) ;mRNA; r:31060-32097